MRRPDRQEIVGPTYRRAQRRIHHYRPPDTPARHAVGLGHAVYGYGPLRHARQRRNAPVLKPIEDDVLIRLIGRKPGRRIPGKLGNYSKLLVREYLPHGLWGVVITIALVLFEKAFLSSSGRT